MTREDVTDLIVQAKVRKGLKSADVAQRVGLSKEWVTAARRGQVTLNAEQAAVIGEVFELPEEARLWLQEVPCKGSVPTAVPTDPLAYRFYEFVSGCGRTFKALIHDEFGDGIMSAIGFKMDWRREPNAAGDRVSIVTSGKFLPYETYCPC